MTTVVPTSFEDPSLSVFRFVSDLSWSDAGPDVAEAQVSRLCMEAEELIATGKWLELARLIVPSAEVIFSKVSEKGFCHFCWINLYNLLEAPDSRFYVYSKTLELAVVGKVTEYIIPSFKKIDTFLKDWKIGIPDQRELFLTISNILKVNKRYRRKHGKGFFKVSDQLFGTFNGEDANVLEKAKEGAVHAIVEFVKALAIFQCDLLDMPAVRQLERDAEYSLLYQLLKIFLTQRLDAYLDYHSANSTLLESYAKIC
ncbi:hypothetical protein Lalb_Chr21g0318341 [Lupinus albus]|uniref:Uncharacterized protein n=1 Tax=Lupinus albus TaxID=3870 RepID=A0A6A4NUM5_LUPAL|nr:hypothetical protein Lalb_Chr21g0318341 [Lupinus albus]